MKYGLNIPPKGPWTSCLWARWFTGSILGSCLSARPPSAKIHVSGGEFNVRREPGRLLRPANRHRHGDGGLSHRRSDRRARAGDGREALLQAFQAQRRYRPEHGNRLQRPRPGRARAGGVLQPLPTKPRPSSSPAISTGSDLRRAACAGFTAAESLPRCRKPRAN